MNTQQLQETQIRTCIVTGQKHHKADMLRIVSFKGADLTIDYTGKAPGRGCYVIVDESILPTLLARNGAVLARTFKRIIRLQELEILKETFSQAIELKKFRPRATKPVVLRVAAKDLPV